MDFRFQVLSCSSVWQTLHRIQMTGGSPKAAWERFLQGVTITLNKFLFHPPRLSGFVGMLTATHLFCPTFAPVQPCLPQSDQCLET